MRSSGRVNLRSELGSFGLSVRVGGHLPPIDSELFILDSRSIRPHGMTKSIDLRFMIQPARGSSSTLPDLVCKRLRLIHLVSIKIATSVLQYY